MTLILHTCWRCGWDILPAPASIDSKTGKVLTWQAGSCGCDPPRALHPVVIVESLHRRQSYAK